MTDTQNYVVYDCNSHGKNKIYEYTVSGIDIETTYQIVNEEPIQTSETDLFPRMKRFWPSKGVGAFLEIHAMQVEWKDGYKHLQIIKNPVHDPAGLAVAARVKTTRGLQDWVICYKHKDANLCAFRFVYDAVRYLAYEPNLRKAMANKPRPKPKSKHNFRWWQKQKQHSC